MSLAGSAITFSMYGFAPNLAFLIFARFLAGMFGGSISAAQAVVADVTLPEDTDRRVRPAFQWRHTSYEWPGDDRGFREYKVASLELLPQTENVFLIYKDGWHATEVASGSPATEWQWTKREATIAFRNPKRNVVFYLDAGGAPDAFGQEQTVTVRLGDQVVDSFSPRGEQLRKVALSAAQLGTGDMAEVKIVVDPTSVPALMPALKNADNRELGIRVFHAFVEPQ